MTYRTRLDVPRNIHGQPYRGIDAKHGAVNAVAINPKGRYPDSENDNGITYVGEGGFDKTGAQIADQEWTPRNAAGLSNLRSGQPVHVLERTADGWAVREDHRIVGAEECYVNGYKQILFHLKPLDSRGIRVVH